MDKLVHHIVTKSPNFSLPNSQFSGYVKVELDLDNYAAKFDVEKQQILVYQSTFTKIFYLINLESYVHILDTDKLKTDPNSLNNLKFKLHNLDVDKRKSI